MRQFAWRMLTLQMAANMVAVMVVIWTTGCSKHRLSVPTSITNQANVIDRTVTTHWHQLEQSVSAPKIDVEINFVTGTRSHSALAQHCFECDSTNLFYRMICK